MRNQRSHAVQILRHSAHDCVGDLCVVETFVGIIEEPTPQERMLQKPLAGAADDFERPFDHNDPLHLQLFQPPLRLFRRRTLRHMRSQPFTFDDQAFPAHFVINPSPDRFERPKGRKGQDQLAARLQMFNQPADGLEPMGPEEHDREVAGDALECGNGLGQGAHVVAFEAKPGQFIPLNGTGARDLATAGIDGHDGPGRSNLLGEVKGRNAMTGGNIENPEAWTQIQLLEQDLGEGSRPIILARKRPAAACCGGLNHASLI